MLPIVVFVAAAPAEEDGDGVEAVAKGAEVRNELDGAQRPDARLREDRPPHRLAH